MPTNNPTSALETLSNRLSSVADIYAARFNISRDELWYISKMTEELGEVNAAYLKLTGRGRVSNQTEVQLRTNLEEEVADLFAFVVLFAKSQQIDLNKALENKWLIHDTA